MDSANSNSGANLRDRENISNMNNVGPGAQQVAGGSTGFNSGIELSNMNNAIQQNGMLGY